MPLLRECPVRVLESGDVLLRAGEPCEVVFVVLSGRLRRKGTSATNPKTLIVAGDSIGELIFASTISAIEPTRLLVIDRDTGRELIRKSREIADNWLTLLTESRHVSDTIAAGEEPKTSDSDHITQDERTGLHNRRWLESTLPSQIVDSAAAGGPFALLLVEIDGFDDYVSRFGKATGDRAYQAVAQAIILNIRPTDVVVSYGAAQLAVVLFASSVTNACLVGERVRSAVSQAGTLPSEESVLHSLTLSVGAAEFQASADASAFLAAAETALHMARASGGNRVAMQ